jgi:hypothetical protein
MIKMKMNPVNLVHPVRIMPQGRRPEQIEPTHTISSLLAINSGGLRKPAFVEAT